MSLFDKIFKKNRDEEKAQASAEGFFHTLRNYRPAFTDWKGEIYESELVRAAIDARARHISKLKVEIHGTAQESLQAKLRQNPNPWQTYSQFLYRLSTILDVHNTAFVVPVYNVRLDVVGYYPVLPKKCEIIQYNGEPWLRYKFERGDTAAVELSKCAILTKYQYKDDFFGDNNDALDEVMRLISMQNQGIVEAVKNSATYRFLAQVNNFSKTEDLARERKRFSEENLTREAGNGGLLLFPNTYTNIQQIKDSSYQVDAEQMKFIRDNVELYFGVNEKVMKNEATGDELDAFFNGAIEPFAIQFSETMTKCIFTDRERAQGSYLIANANRLQYMTTTAKVSLAQQMLDRGVMSINEARALFNYESVDGGEMRTIRGEYKNANNADGVSAYSDDPIENVSAERNGGVTDLSDKRKGGSNEGDTK